MKKSQIKDILERGDKTEVLTLFSIVDGNEYLIPKKFQLWSRVFFPNVFKTKDAFFHKEMIQNLSDLYVGKFQSYTNIAFRSASKTTYTKLFIAFVLCNDHRDKRRKYFKIISEDPVNSKQSTTDLWNMLVDEKVKRYYSHIFEKTDKKQEETMSSFTLATGVKVISSTVDRNQRGAVQGSDASRPDFIWMDDIENSRTIQSLVISEDIWRTMEEAISSRSVDGVITYTVNYISKRRNVQRIIERARRSPDVHKLQITPILKNGNSTWPEAFSLKTIEQLRRDSESFESEYMCNPSGTIDSYFSEDFLNLHPNMPILAKDGSWHYFYKLEKDHQYILGVDPASGGGGDYATIVVIDWTIRTVVAYFQDKWTNPEKLGDEASNKGTLFNKALVVVERNNHGHAVLLQMKHNKYSNLYEEINNSEYVENYTEKLGFTTTAQSKPAILASLASAINNFAIIIPIEKIKEELISFPREYVDAKKLGQDVDGHWDLVMGLALAFEGRHQLTGKLSTTKYA